MTACPLLDNTAASFNPRTNDTDVNGDTLTITAKTNGDHGTVTITGGNRPDVYTDDRLHRLGQLHLHDFRWNDDGHRHGIRHDHRPHNYGSQSIL